MRTNEGIFNWPTRKEWRENGIVRTSVGLALFAVVCGPIFGPIFLYGYVEGRYDEWWRENRSEAGKQWKEQRRMSKLRQQLYQEQRSNTRPQPLESRRQRALTANTWEENSTTKSPMSKDDDGSLLDKLPWDIRIVIWKQVIGGHEIALFRGDRRLLHVLQDEEGIEEPLYGSRMPEFYRINSTKNISALLKTCRGIYRETVSLLYTDNKFSLWQNDTLTDFKSTTLPQRFNSIKSLKLHWQFRNSWTFERNACGNLIWQEDAPWDAKTWESACRTLQSMEGLQELLVIIRGPFLSNIHVVEVLNSLKKVRKIEKGNFNVRVPWPSVIARTKNDAVDRRFEDKDFPFHVFRPEKVIPDSFTGLEWVEHALS